MALGVGEAAPQTPVCQVGPASHSVAQRSAASSRGRMTAKHTEVKPILAPHIFARVFFRQPSHTQKSRSFSWCEGATAVIILKLDLKLLLPLVTSRTCNSPDDTGEVGGMPMAEERHYVF